MQYWHFYVFLCCGHSYHLECITPKLDTCLTCLDIFSGGGYFQIRRSGGLGPHIDFGGKTLGQGPAKFTK